MKLKLALMIAVALGLPAASHAQVYLCSDPSYPSCLTGIGTFDTEVSFYLCKGEMERYRDSVRRFNECLEQASDEALAQYNRAVDYWNCEASGASYCPLP